jgi:hypothetical protein
MDRYTRRHLPPVHKIETIAIFGEANLVRHLDGRLEIVGGNEDERRQARDWACQFLRPAGLALSIR